MQQQAFPKVEVVASRREQRQPPPPMAAPPKAQPAAVPESLPAPSWAAEPPPGWRLQVIKDGKTLQDVSLDKSAFLFGRCVTYLEYMLHQVWPHPEAEVRAGA